MKVELTPPVQMPAKTETPASEPASADLFASFEQSAFKDGVLAPSAAKPATAPVEEPAEALVEVGNVPPEENEGAEYSADAPLQDDSAAEAPEDKPKKPNNRTAQARIAGLIQRNKELQRQLDAQRAAPTPSAPTPAAAAAPPRVEDYEGVLDPRYIDAYIDYVEKSGTKVNNTDPVPLAPEPVADQDDLRARLFALADKGMEESDDYYDAVVKTAEAGDWPLPESVARLAADSEVGHLVLRKLAEDVGTAYKLARLSDTPLKQAAMFGRLEAELMAARTKPTPAPKPPKSTKAPEPPAAKARGGNGQFTPPGDTTDFAAFEAAWRNSQRR